MTAIAMSHISYDKILCFALQKHNFKVVLMSYDKKNQTIPASVLVNLANKLSKSDKMLGKPRFPNLFDMCNNTLVLI